MVQGTTSDAGKTTFVAGLCRILNRAGVSVAPFKPQNMALNSAVTADGGEIGRAQALQAQASRLPPHTDMNPVLLKPTSDTTAQIIIHGRARADMDAQHFHAYKKEAMAAVLESFDRLRGRHAIVVAEGAGSPAEVNLREGDIANMGFAEAVDCPVVLIADIDRGGVFAQLLGTLECLAESERRRVRGFVINRFRGDIGLLADGLQWITERTGKPVYGVVPYIQGLHLDAEDAIAPAAAVGESVATRLRIVVPIFPRISNHTDFDPLRGHPQIDLMLVGPNMTIPSADLIVLGGSKNVQADMQWLEREGWRPAIARHLRYGGKLLGICGGMQMLGTAIHDPLGVEQGLARQAGFGWLDFETTLGADKILRQVRGCLAFDSAATVSGYEMHMGRSHGAALTRPAIDLQGQPDGAVSADGQVMGTYVHGLFDDPSACVAMLRWAGLARPVVQDHGVRREASLERLADVLAEHVDIERLLADCFPMPASRARTSYA